MTPEERKAKIKTVVRVASGNFLEMYDFMITIALVPGYATIGIVGKTTLIELLAWQFVGIGEHTITSVDHVTEVDPPVTRQR